ncbi:hypothetical protein [Altibacter sp. HG106]|uniref:hypothetical protein n=1 Tax=Altibacter sp. HG106 TaxID=3023937 RepID=UPI002350F5E9|nr:hypothetical protein [Altibacter sp. HG106]MDC7994283.1 hypothetical protein [Altibacter sp. HG106]
MKKSLPLLVIIIVVLCSMIACEQEVVPASTDTQQLIQQTSNEDSPSTIIETDGPMSKQRNETATFEKRLHWTSFITAKIIRYNTTGRSQLVQSLGLMNNTVNLNILIGDNSNYPAFNAAFKDYLYYYIEGTRPDPDDEPEDPGFPPVPPGGNSAPDLLDNTSVSYVGPAQMKSFDDNDGNNDPAILAAIDVFISYMIDDNCTELYFPNGLNLNGSFELTSTAHPLTTANWNNGILRTYTGQSGGISGSDGRNPVCAHYNGCVTHAVASVDNTYVLNNDNIIVARPKRNPFAQLDDPCFYGGQYSGIDFTDLLD